MQAKPTVKLNQQRNEAAKTVSARQIVRASELAQYRYCAKAWWLGSVLGKPSTNTRELQSGTAAHKQHGRAVWLSSALRIAAFALVVVALLVLLMALR
jgi:CRISPR/Cas system-associated exonuclease Cas4 (RecB family)